MQKHHKVIRSSLKYPGAKKHSDARASTPVRIFCAGGGAGDEESRLYSKDPNIIEHIRIAKMRPKGSSENSQIQLINSEH